MNKHMEKEYFQAIIPQYAELNRICESIMSQERLSYENLKFIVEFHQQYKDVKDFEDAVLGLIFDEEREKYTLILKSLHIEIEKSIRLYGALSLGKDTIYAACEEYHNRYDRDINELMPVVYDIRQKMTEAGHHYGTVSLCNMGSMEEENAKEEYESGRAEYDKAAQKLEDLYALWRKAATIAFRYNDENCCKNIYKLSTIFLNILKKYIPDTKDKSDEAERQEEEQQDVTKEPKDYFTMSLLSRVYEACVGVQFEKIPERSFYAIINLQSCDEKLKINKGERVRVCYVIHLMSGKLSKQDRDEWKIKILKQLGIKESFYKGKYTVAASPYSGKYNNEFKEDMESIFNTT